jgi:hypothetical protein
LQTVEKYEKTGYLILLDKSDGKKFNLD